MALTPEQRTIRARAGAYALHAMGGTTTARATAASMARFEREVDPDGVLGPEERARRAAFARRAYMSRLALRSSLIRSKKKDRPDHQSGRSERMEANDDGHPAAA